MKDDVQEPLRIAFRNLTIAILDHAFKGRPEIARMFGDLPSDKREEIETEIKRKADLIAAAMCRKLVEHGFIERTPPDHAITRLYRETLREYESP